MYSSLDRYNESFSENNSPAEWDGAKSHKFKSTKRIF